MASDDFNNQRCRKRASLIAAAIAFAFCSNAAAAEETGAKSVRTLLEIRNSDVVRQHWELSCGAAAIATLLTYQLGHPTSEADVALDLLRRTNPVMVRVRLGFSLLDLKRYAARHDFDAAGYAKLSLGDLAAMAPAIVPIRSNGFDHFVVVRGIRDDRVVFADPAFGNRTLPAEDFEDIWANRIAFIVYAPGRRDAPNRMGTPDELMMVPSPRALRTIEDSMRVEGEGF